MQATKNSIAPSRPDRPQRTSYRAIVLTAVAVLPLGVGLILLLAGFLIDPLWPGQDMTPALQAQPGPNAEQAAKVYRVGFFWLTAGAIWFGACLRQVRRRHR